MIMMGKRKAAGGLELSAAAGDTTPGGGKESRKEEEPGRSSAAPGGGVDPASLEPLVRAASPGLLAPLQFFPAWQGVLTLAYKGFPPSLADLKANLSEHCTLPKENPGSLWPKTSLGCLREGQRLSPDQLATLLSICEGFTGELAEAEPVRVAALTATVYACRSQERRAFSHTMPLEGEPSSESPREADLERARKVAAEPQDPGYWFQASKDGNRESHYRGDAMGATLVHFLACPPPGLERLRRQVEEALPGMYCWFEEPSLHVTLRALT